jgi:hypothetical protein
MFVHQFEWLNRKVTVGVGQHREWQIQLFDHSGMLPRRIDVDGGNNGASRCEFTMSECHADQLTVAVRSPIPSQKEQYHGMAAVIRQGPRFTTLIQQCEVRRFGHPLNIDPSPTGLVRVR